MFSKERLARGQAELRAKRLKNKFGVRVHSGHYGVRSLVRCHFCDKQSGCPLKSDPAGNRFLCTNLDCMRKFRRDPGKLFKRLAPIKAEPNVFGMRDDIFQVYSAHLGRKFHSRFRRAAH